MPGWRVGPRRHLMGPAGVRSIIDEVSRWNTFRPFSTSSTYANRFKWIQSPDIFFTPFSTSSICANGFTQYAKVGYYREFSPDGSEIEWGLVGGPVWKNMVKSPGNIFWNFIDTSVTQVDTYFKIIFCKMHWYLLVRLGTACWLGRGMKEERSAVTWPTSIPASPLASWGSTREDTSELAGRPSW